MALKVYFIVGHILSHPFPDVMLSQAWLYLDRGVFLASFLRDRKAGRVLLHLKSRLRDRGAIDIPSIPLGSLCP